MSIGPSRYMDRAAPRLRLAAVVFFLLEEDMAAEEEDRDDRPPRYAEVSDVKPLQQQARADTCSRMRRLLMLTCIAM